MIKLFSDCVFNKFGDILKIRDWAEVGKDLMVSSRLLQQWSKHGTSPRAFHP